MIRSLRTAIPLQTLSAEGFLFVVVPARLGRQMQQVRRNLKIGQQ